MKHIFLIILTLIGCMNLFAQSKTPGFIGKRFSVGVNVEQKNFLFRIDENEFFDDYGLELSTEYALHRNWSVLASHRFFKTVGFSSKRNEGLNYRISHTKMAFRFYFKNVAAPVGAFVQFGAGKARIRMRFDGEYVDNESTNGSLYFINLAVGKQKNINRRLLIKYSINFNLPLNSTISDEALNPFVVGYSYYSSSNRYLQAVGFRSSVGLAYLLF